MDIFEAVLLILSAAVVLHHGAGLLALPSPVILAFTGAAVALVPGAPAIDIDPGLVLALFVAPILLDAAYETSLRDLKLLWLPVACLVVIAVGVTTVAVAGVAKLLVPEMSWAAAIALGAITAPPDAASAIAILRRLRLPRMLVALLEGESLLNDASALIIYRLAVAAALGASPDAGAFANAVALGVFGSIAVGWLLGKIGIRLSARISDPPTAIIVQFLGTFGVWLLAERLGLSPIITIVAFGLTIARIAPTVVPASMRLATSAVWATVVLILNVFAFVLIGLQLKPILEQLSRDEVRDYLVVGGFVLTTVILARISWVFLYSGATRLWVRWRHVPPTAPLARPTVRGTLVVAWCGMRGIVTLATALALPPDMPQRGLILFCAFIVVLGTLAIQGLTLKPLVKAMRFRDDESIDREVRLAWDELAAESERRLQLNPDPDIRRFAAFIADRGGKRVAAPKFGAMVAELFSVQREVLIRLRSEGRIGDSAFRRVEEDLDWSEVAATRRSTRA